MGLTNVLPGLRQIRAPLAAGYLWLLFVYLVANLNEVDREGGIAKDVADLGAALSPVGIAVAISFAAYLLGSFSAWAAPGVVKGLLALHLRRERLGLKLSSRGYATMDDLLAPRVSRGQIATLAEARPVARDLLDELGLIKTRLIGAEPELHAEVDRLHAEAEFRFAVLPPLTAVSIVAVLAIPFAPPDDFFLHTLAILGVIIVVEFLWFQAVGVLTQANDKLLDAVFLERVGAPVLERLGREEAL